MSDWSRKIPFQVDIAGVIHIMGSALYSRPDAAVRELLQNAHDAVCRRRQTDLNYQGQIHVRQLPESNWLEVDDDGNGLNEQDAEAYLGTLGIGLTGLMKGRHPSAAKPAARSGDMIGMFGIGMFSAFMIADEIVVESRKDNQQAIRWQAGTSDEITLSSGSRKESGTSVQLRLKPEFARFANDEDLLSGLISEYADFLSVPIFLNDNSARANIIRAAWFEPTADEDAIELELSSYFDETPLDVIPVRLSGPVPMTGALYVSPQRTPGFGNESLITATVLRMVISRDIRGLLPHWASFLRGVLELEGCTPTASREDLVRDEHFFAVREQLEAFLLNYFATLADQDPPRLESIISWHRYTWAGAALMEPGVRSLLRRSYRFPTSRGLLTFDEVLEQSDANALTESEFEKVVWCNTDRRQESWVNSLFAEYESPCVHALRSFEESLLAALVSDSGPDTDLRFASPDSSGFAEEILKVKDLQAAPKSWSDQLDDFDVDVHCASFRSDLPVMAFLNERHELRRTFDQLKKQGTIPSGFQRLIDAHFSGEQQPRNSVILNRNHRLVSRALEQETNSPLASVLRLLIGNALSAAGATVPNVVRRQQVDDLDWIAECLWGNKNE